LQLDALAADAEALRKAYEGSTQARAAADKRRERIPQIISQHRIDAGRNLKLSFDRMFNGIEIGLPSALKDYKLPSGGGVLSMFRKKKMADEASEFCKSYVQRAFNQWSGKNGEAQKELKKVLDAMFENVASEIAKIERQYREIHFELTGKMTATEIETGPGMADRILSTAIGFAAGDPSAILTGYTDGWKGLALTITTQLAVILSGVALGVSAPVLIPAAIVAAIVARGALAHFNGENDAKERVLHIVLDGDRDATPRTPPLRDLRTQVHGTIDENLEIYFCQIRDGVMLNVNAVVKEEEASIEQIYNDSRRSLDEKRALTKKLEAARETVAGVRKRMRNLIAEAKQ
jgi:hypothetical protein